MAGENNSKVRLKATKPHFQYHSPFKEDVSYYFGQRNFKRDYSYDFVRDVANAYSYVLAGKIAEDSFVPTNDPYNLKVQKYIANIDWDVYSGDTPLQKALAIVTALANLTKNQSCKIKKPKEKTEQEKKEEKEKQEQKAKDAKEKKEKADKEKKEKGDKSDEQKGLDEPEDSDENGDDEGQEQGDDGSDGDEQDGLDGKPSDQDGDGDGDPSDEKGEGKGKGKGDDSDEAEGDEMETFGGAGGSGQDIENMVRKLNKMMSDFKELEKSSAKYVFNPMNDAPENLVNTFDSNQMKILENMAILSSRGKIKSRKKALSQKISPMSEYGEVAAMTNISNIALPTFGYKFATKQVLVKQAQQANKQMLVLLIDDSGSMNCSEKINWIWALLYNRLDAVIANKAVLYIGMFLNRLDETNIIKVENKADAMRLIKRKWFPRLGGGGTDIGHAVETACAAIKRGKFGGHDLKGEKPEIVVINDGQDHVNASYKPDVITHGFILGDDNDGMKGMIKNCGGHYERFL